MKLTPEWTARSRVVRASSSETCPQLPPIAQAPKLISETIQPVLPRGRYFMIVSSPEPSSPVVQRPALEGDLDRFSVKGHAVRGSSYLHCDGPRFRRQQTLAWRQVQTEYSTSIV